MYTLLKNLRLGHLNTRVYMTYNNRDVDAYLYTISELSYHLFMYQISPYILYKQNQAYLFLVCIFFFVYFVQFTAKTEV